MAIRTQEQNLDSLLDTMANVVGILVVLVAVTQLSVGEAVDRITSRRAAGITVTADDVVNATARAEEVETAVVAAQGKLEAYTPETERAGWLLEEVRPHLEDLEALAGREPLRGDPVGALAARIERQQGTADELSAEVAAQRSQLSGLEALIGSVPSESRPKVARLPNPRTPPSGADQIAILCRHGRVALLDLDGMRGMLSRGIRDALGDDRAVVYEDRPWLINLFAKKRIGSGNFYWSFREDDRAFFADIKWSDIGYGETFVDLLASESELLRKLEGTDQRGRYLRFYVWNDSFEVYLEARYLAERMGWEIGWLPIDGEEEVGINLLGAPRRRTLLD